jgi:hypothetical protein
MKATAVIAAFLAGCGSTAAANIGSRHDGLVEVCENALEIFVFVLFDSPYHS